MLTFPVLPPAPADDSTSSNAHPASPLSFGAGRFRLPRPRGPLSRAILALISGPPLRTPGVLGGAEALRLWSEESLEARAGLATPNPASGEQAWWQGSDDAALALVVLQCVHSGELSGVDAGWSEGDLVAELTAALAEPLPSQPVPREGSDRPCAVVREVLQRVTARSESPYLPWLRTASLGQLHDALMLAGLQWRREGRLRRALHGLGLTGTGSTAAGPTAAGVADAGEGVAALVRAVGVPAEDQQGLLDVLPTVPLWRWAMVDHLAVAPTRTGVGLGWLVASDALLASGRYPTGAVLRAHGFPPETAAAWDQLFEARARLSSLQDLENLLSAAPELATGVLAGTRAALESASALERALELTWREGRRPLTWSVSASEVPGVLTRRRESELGNEQA